MVQEVASIQSSELGGIGKAIQDVAHNEAAAAASKRADAVVMEQKQIAAGREAEAKTALAAPTGGEGSLSRRAHDASTALGNKEEMGLAIGMASGTNGWYEAANTLAEVIGDRDPFKSTIPGAETFDSQIQGAVARADAKPRAICTSHEFGAAALHSRANITSGALTGDTGNTGTWGGVNQTTAMLTKKLENSLHKTNEHALNNSRLVKQKLDAKAGQYMRMGMGQTAAYTHASIASPKGPTHIGVEEGTGDVA